MSARTVVEDTAVSIELDKLRKRFPRFDDIWDAWTWRLCRGPEIDAVKIPETDPQSYLIKLPDLSVYNFPLELTILYQFSDDEVVILAVRVLEAASHM
jgi:hypothetical protein